MIKRKRLLVGMVVLAVSGAAILGMQESDNAKSEGVSTAETVTNVFGAMAETAGQTAEEETETVVSEEDMTEEQQSALTDGYGIYADRWENLESNAFFDALVYTGYNIEKHRSDGLMWEYVLASQKRGKGWLSDITYNGGSSGCEVSEDGMPDISFFEKYGLVCASYATYVYFSYLPNVAGIDTSELTMPEKTYNANDWYLAAKDWVEKGYAKHIEFEAALKGGLYSLLKLRKSRSALSLLFVMPMINLTIAVIL